MCKCNERVNQLLEAKNAQLDLREIVIFLTGETYISDNVLLKVLKIDPNKRKFTLPILQATFCPFCGDKYPKHNNHTPPADPCAEEEKK